VFSLPVFSLPLVRSLTAVLGGTACTRQDSLGECLSGSLLRPQFENSHLPDQELKRWGCISTVAQTGAAAQERDGPVRVTSKGVSAAYKFAFAWFTRLVF